MVGSTVLSRLSTGSTDGTARSQEGTATPSPSPTPTPPETVWPLFQYDQSNSGSWKGGLGPRAEAGARWGHVEGGEYLATPVVTDAELFVADGGEGVVRAVDRTTGEELWSTELVVRAARMTMKDRTLYVPTERTGAQFEALDPDDGSRKWSVNLGNSATAVVARENALYAATTGGVQKVSPISKDVAWHYDGIALMDTSVAIGNDSIYAAGTQYGKVVKLGVASGQRSWANNLEGAAQDAPTLSENTVVVPMEKYLVGLTEDSGRELWRYESPVGSSVAVRGGNVYGTTTGGDAFSLSLDSGQERWRTGVGAGSVPPLLVGNTLYVAGTDGTLAAMNPSTGSVAWSTKVGAKMAANPAVVGGELYTVDRAGRIGAFAAGASGGFDTQTPTDAPTDAPSDTPTDTPTDAPTPTDTDGDGEDSDDVDGDGDTPNPSTPAVGTDTPADDGGGLDLPLVGGAVAGVAALLGGGLWWRKQQKDEYDPLG